MWDGFEVFDFSEGVPYLSVTSNGITFNKSVVMKLDYPAFVCLLINRELRQLAIVRAEEETPRAAVFYKPKKSGAISVRWNGKDLLNTIQSLMGWNLVDRSFRVEGTLIREEGAMFFDLNQATEIV